MKKSKPSIKRICIAAGAVVMVVFLSVGTGFFAAREITEIHHREAQNMLYYYSDKIMLLLKGTLNEADILAQTALVMKGEDTSWFEDAAAPLLEREEVCFAFLFQEDTMVRSLPETEYGNLAGKNLDEFSYIFTMAKVVKDLVIEGPSVMEFDENGESVFLFLQPIVDKDDNAYIGEVIVALRKDFVLEQLGLEKLSEQGYDYELWRVEPQNGWKEVVSGSNTEEDFSEGEKITFYLPTQWNLSIKPITGWLTQGQKGGIILTSVLMALFLLAFIFQVRRLVILKRTLEQTEYRDSQTNLLSQRGFTRQLKSWFSEGNYPVMLFYFSIEGYTQTAQLIGPQKEADYLGSIYEHLKGYIRSPFLAGRAGGGDFLIAVREEMEESQQQAFSRGLALELLLKYRIDNQKGFLMPRYHYICCSQENSGAEAEITKLIHEYYARVSRESPVKTLTEKCRQLIEGNNDVVFDEYTNPDMLELSKTFNRYRKQVEQLAYSDPVFNVGNRPKFFRDANMLISYDKKRKFSLFCVDISNFSQYNELFSADVGDAILHEVKRRLSRSFGSYLYRINGDVFLGISLSEESMESLIRRLLQMFEIPVTVKTYSFNLQIRIAACRYPTHGESPSGLIDCVQSTLRYAKASNQNMVIYNDSLDKMLRTEADILHRLENAMKEQTLEIWYQPIMLLETGHYSAVEAMARLSDGKNGYYPAGQVISLAERNGIIELLGDYILLHACSFMKSYGDALGLSRMGINLSVQQLLVENCASHLQTLIQETQVNMEQITLEITESILIQSIDQAAKTLETLRQAGIRIALDDFGVGYSSLNYLSNLPIDVIKIDRSLTKQILSNYKQHSLLKSIVELASVNGLKVVAEGVETEEENKMIAASGVHYIQGYYYARPMSEKALLSFLKENKR